MTQKLLYDICQSNSSTTALVQNAHKIHLDEEAAALAAKPPVNFDHYSKSCWRTINVSYAALSGSRQYEAIPEITNFLHRSRKAIVKQAGRNTKWETRRNALETLRKISKSVALAEELQIRHELMKNEDDMAPFGQSMAALARSMIEGEKKKYKQEGLYSKLLELESLYGAYSIGAIYDDLWAAFEENAVAKDHEDEDDEDEENEHITYSRSPFH